MYSNFYKIVAPDTIRSYSDYHVSVSTHYADVKAIIKVEIIGDTKIEAQQVEIPENGEKTINFKIPKLHGFHYKLEANGISGFEFHHTEKLKVLQKHNIILIQTDKAIYKPGDLIRFRILILDSNTRPTKIEEPVEIKITDAKYNCIKQFDNVEIKNGVFSDELQLSQYPILGDWVIKIKCGEQREQKIIQIGEYVLPKFEAIIDAPKHALYNDDNLRITVRAKYTYGKPVKGNAVITFKPNSSLIQLSAQKTLMKTVPLDGMADVGFDLTKLSQFGTNKQLCALYNEATVTAEIEEKLTGNKMNAVHTIKIHKNRYQIELIDEPKTYTPNKQFKVTVAIKNYDGTPVQDAKNPVVFTLRPINYTRIRFKIKEVNKAKLNENGVATVEFTISDLVQFALNPENRFYSPSKQFEIQINYKDIETKVSEIREQLKIKSYNKPDLKVRNLKSSFNEEVEVNIKLDTPTDYFVYQIIGRGDIVKSERVNLPEEVTEYNLKFKPTFQMLPKAKLYVYFIMNPRVNNECINLEFEHQLENQIEISTPEESKPGEEIDISITTDPDSYVGLLGVDQSVLLLKNDDGLTKDKIFSELSSFNIQSSSEILAEKDAGLIVLTNAYLRAIGGGYPDTELRFSCRGGCGYLNTIPIIRKEFPETWIFDTIQSSEKMCNGLIKLQKRVPDTITSWILTGFSINSKTGLGITDEPKKIRVFQPFFVSTNLPYSIKRGEIFNIPVTVFNYMNQKLEAKITLDNSNKEFDFIESKSDINGILSKYITIDSGSGASVSFSIRPNKIGNITLKIRAITQIAGDAIEQILLVEAEGITKYKNKSVLINLTKLNNQYKQEFLIDMPKNIVSDSAHIEISIVGDLLGPTIENLGYLIRKPFGCGEQNMINFVPNILVLKYLKNLGKLTPIIEKRAKNFLEIGYQNELNYKHLDGSYSVFGSYDNRGSTWLTAYVAKSFSEAAKYTQIDEEVIAEALDFLSKNQTRNGNFIETGTIFDFKHADSKNQIYLTAFTLLAFMENKKTFDICDNVIEKGLKYLAKNIKKEIKVFPLAIATYVLNLAKHKAGNVALEKLKELAVYENDTRFWTNNSTNDVESTSYALLSLLEANESGDYVLPVLKWLVSQRNSLGGFSSTHATVIGLQALIKFSENFGSNGKDNVQINITDDQNTKSKFIVNNNNYLSLQTCVLPKDARHIMITAKGIGTILAQVSCRYNIETLQAEPRFKLKTKVKNIEMLKMDVFASFIPSKSEKQSNMAIMEINLPSGYIIDVDIIKTLKKIAKRVETIKGNTVIILYFNFLDKNEICIPIEAIKTHDISQQKPASVIIYDYYDNTRQARTFYSTCSS